MLLKLESKDQAWHTFLVVENKPSLDFFLKIKDRYPETDLNWIISGKKTKVAKKNKIKSSEIESVIILYKDGTFKKN